MPRVGARGPILGGGTTKPASWGVRFPGRGGDTGTSAFFFSVTNLNEFLRSMDEYWKDAQEAALDALGESLRRRVLVPSLRLCPIDTGALRASAWSDASLVRGALHGSVGYDTDYALYVHEIPARHKAPTQWKFLELPFAENSMAVANDVLEAVVEEW